MSRKVFVAVTVALLLGMPAPAGAETVVEPFEYGYFYGTFGEDPNTLLFVGGTAEEFCEGDPGTIKARTKVLKDGSVRVSADKGNQPIYLYDNIPQDEGAPDWLERVCNSEDEFPAPFASGKAKLRVRDSYAFEGGPPTRLSNSVKGKALGSDGTKYKVRGAADIPFENGAPVGAPPDWVSFSLTAQR